MSFLPKNLFFVSDSDIQIIDEELMRKLDEWYAEGIREFKNNNILGFLKYLEQIWNCLPKTEEKLDVSFYIAQKLSLNNLKLGNYNDAMKWAKETLDGPEFALEEGYSQLLVGKVAYESGDMETATKYLTIADKKSNGKIFVDDDMKYLKFIRGNDKNMNPSKRQKKKKDINIYNEEIKQYTEEELERLSELDVSSKVIDTVNKAEDLMEEKKYKKAIILYEKAFGSLEYPVQDFLYELHIQEGIGEAYFWLGEYEKAIKILNRILITPYGDETDNSNILLRLGQSLIELGELERGKEFLLKAYTIDGSEIFDEEDPKYYDLIKREDEI